jgi:hypothetical protein
MTGSLLVAYDESKLILRFDVVRRDAGVCGLFDDVTEMISRHTPSLKRVEPPGGRVMSLPRGWLRKRRCGRVRPS